jgi:penicillin-binding protein 2
MNTDARRYVILVLFLLVGSIYTIRLFYMQVIDDSWTLRAQEIAEKRKQITPPRGVVFDRQGKKIVANKTYFNLMMVEAKIKDFDTVAFAKLIGWSVQKVKNRFWEIRKGEGRYYNRHTGKTTSNYQKIRAYPFVKEMAMDEMAAIAPFLHNFPGFYEEITSMRSYPYANAANILGYLSEVNGEEIKEDKFYRPGENIGRTGLEKYYEKELRGIKGIHYIVTSALNNAIEPYANGKYDTIARQGPPLRLGVDIALQAYGEKLLQNKRGCIVAIEPSTGEILALVSAPTFDPNLFVGKRSISKNYPALLKDPSKPLYPRPLSAEYPPGSTFKLIQALVGMQEGVIEANTGFPCTKSMVGCHNHPSASSVPEAVQYSCNPYFYYTVRKIIQQGKAKKQTADAEIGLDKWSKYMHSFGFGVRLETDITGVRSGLIPDPKYYDKWYGHHNWSFSTIRSISIGQGEVKATPLQLANLAAIIANRGWYFVPHFVKSIGSKGPLPIYEKKHYTMVDRKYYDPVIEGMRKVVNESGGTGSQARMKDVVVCGKTGTVQNPQGKDHSVFIAFAPMHKPKIAIAVFIENAGFGGTWAAPISNLMLEKYLKKTVSDTIKENRILKAKLD